MGYPRYTTVGRLLHASSSRGHTPRAIACLAGTFSLACVKGPRTALIFVLLFSFVFSTLPSTSSRSATTESHDMTPHHMMGSHDMTGLHDMTGSLDTTGHDMAGQQPCDHGQDCKCDDRPMSHCCAQVAPVAAIWTSLPPSPQLRSGRCTDVDLTYLHSEDINPPTPPPRILLV